MSTGKRIAKRSILGTRVAACRVDGLYYTGVICSTKVVDGFSPRYSVRFDGTRFVAEFGPHDLVGPGFLSVCDIELLPDQKIHVTHNGRETDGIVLSHRPDLDEVWVEIKQGFGKVRSADVSLLSSYGGSLSSFGCASVLRQARF